MAWYEKLGFANKGNSKAQFGGGGWYDLVCIFGFLVSSPG
jgi:hypothetical protein